MFLGTQINSRKNIQQDVTIIAAAGQENSVIAVAVEAPTLISTNSVGVGSKINTVYIEAWLYGNATAGINSPFTWMLFKNPGNNLTVPDPALAGSDDNKKFAFAMGRGLIGNAADGQPGYVIRGWFPIPKRYRRFGYNDRLILAVKNDTANDINFCKLFIYKWYQ